MWVAAGDWSRGWTWILDGLIALDVNASGGMNRLVSFSPVLAAADTGLVNAATSNIQFAIVIITILSLLFSLASLLTPNLRTRYILLLLGNRARQPARPLYNIASGDLRVVVCHDGNFVLTPAFEGFEDEDAGCGVKR